MLGELFAKYINNLVPGPTKENRDVMKVINNHRIRSCEIECLYAEVRYNFKNAMKDKKLNRYKILKIRKYLEENLYCYEHKKFKNDCHAIYTMLMAKDITVNILENINRIIKKSR